MMNLIDYFVHIDVHLLELLQTVGPWMYVVLFLIIFCETGLVVTPILPGDSLLFAAGALTALPGSPLDVNLLMICLIVAGVLGDAVNYSIGKLVGPRVFHQSSSRLFNKQHLLRAQAFYEKYGPTTIILSRFVPIVRTFAPFVAGVGTMAYRKFAVYNVLGAVIWVCSFTLAGHFFGDLPIVKRNFQIVVLAIIVVSVLPVLVEFWRARRANKAAL